MRSTDAELNPRGMAMLSPGRMVRSREGINYNQNQTRRPIEAQTGGRSLTQAGSHFQVTLKQVNG